MTSLGNLTLHQLFDWGSGIVLISSLLNSFLPPYEWFSRWPSFQAVYKIIVMTIGRWGAINLKSAIYPEISQNAVIPLAVPLEQKP